MERSKSIEITKDSNHTGKFTVFVGGIPKSVDFNLAYSFMKTHIKKGNINIITDSKLKCRGFAFVTFDTLDDAHIFLDKEIKFNDKNLDCKLSMDHNDYIATCLISIREPKKIFIDQIPQKINKSQLSNLVKPFGEIDEVILIEKSKKPTNFAYITFTDTESAQNAVKKGEIILEEDISLPIIFARPKFSKKMLVSVPMQIRDYIRQIQKGQKVYDP